MILKGGIAFAPVLPLGVAKGRLGLDRSRACVDGVREPVQRLGQLPKAEVVAGIEQVVAWCRQAFPFPLSDLCREQVKAIAFDAQGPQGGREAHELLGFEPAELGPQLIGLKA